MEDDLTWPRGFPPDPERCEVCRNLRARMRHMAAARLVEPFLRVRDLRAMHENTAHTDGRAPARARVGREADPMSAAQERVVIAQERVVDRYLMGASVTRLAHEYGVSQGWLAALLDDLGIARRGPAEAKAIQRPRPYKGRNS
ncbi:hypothetical protein ABZ714_17700 [Streptomyces sp. NPDC006798]|uniref:hypothetical protein n=1 Tax=Streptomyces sp. NPDC006798 TaxID=3155462 RepID=UPI0033D45E78